MSARKRFLPVEEIESSGTEGVEEVSNYPSEFFELASDKSAKEKKLHELKNGREKNKSEESLEQKIRFGEADTEPV